MADQDDLYYLQPGFDLNSVTVPRLRSILVAHNIPYPSSAKKAELIDIFNQELIPKARKLLRAQAKVRRTSKGITDVPSSQASVDEDETDEKESMPPPPPPKTPRPRKSNPNLNGIESVPTPKTSRKSKTPSTRKSTTRTPRASDTETDLDTARPSARKSRRSTPSSDALPAASVRIEEAKDKRQSLEAGDSPFTQDNPFQSGSSPPSDSRRVSSTSRSRKSLGSSTKRKSISKRRETRSPDTVRREEDRKSFRSAFEIPVSHLSTGADGVETTEEFTNDAKQELAHDLITNTQLAKTRSKALIRQKKKPTSTAVKATPVALLVTVLAGIAGWYRQEKINVGYCGVGEPNWSLSSNDNIPAWVHENLQPICEPCPSHGICYPGMDVKCEDDFVLLPHPLSLNGLVPLPPTCEPDSEKERRVKAVADRAIEELRERRAAYECGTEVTTSTTDEQPTTLIKSVHPKLEVSEDTLKQTVSKMRRKGMTADEFEDLWRGALGDIVKRDEIEVVKDESGGISLSSSSLARLPFTCAIRRSFVRTLSQYRLPVAILIAILSALGYGRRRLVQYTHAKTQTPQLVAMTLDRLATQAALKEDGRASESFISIAQLRDDVLRHVFSVAERERVWQRVRMIVEANSNVRAATREGGKTGEWSRVWEWIGPARLEGRASGGLLQDASESVDNETQDNRQVEVRKWNEGRAIY